jgi:hypothetical protein
MELAIRSIGNSAGVVLPKEVLMLDCYKTGGGYILAENRERLEKVRGAFPVLNYQRFFCE